MVAKFPFSDFHAFKDFVVFAQTYLPDRFRPREGVGPEGQWTLELAFEGLRLGLEMGAQEKGEQPALADGRAILEQAYTAYTEGRTRDGFLKLEDLRRVLQRVRAA